MDPSLNGYELERRMDVIARIRDEASAVPGVRSVSLGEIALMTNSSSSSTVKVEGYESKEDEDMNPGLNGVGPEFFSTLGIPLLSGRDFTESDDLEAPESGRRERELREVLLRRRRSSRVGGSPSAAMTRRSTIVGLVGDGKSMSLREEPERFFYLPYTQSQDLGGVTFYVRAALDPETLGARIREAVASVDSALPVTDMKTMNRQIEESLYVERMVAALSVAFGGLATLLAAVGLYGVLSYTVAARTREIGIRVALGAERKRSSCSRAEGSGGSFRARYRYRAPRGFFRGPPRGERALRFERAGSHRHRFRDFRSSRDGCPRGVHPRGAREPRQSDGGTSLRVGAGSPSKDSAFRVGERIS